MESVIVKSKELYRSTILWLIKFPMGVWVRIKRPLYTYTGIEQVHGWQMVGLGTVRGKWSQATAT